jgi:hypothetical protein
VKYQYLKAQNLSPSAIMASLYESITGIGAVTPARRVAAQALIAFLFESCDIYFCLECGSTVVWDADKIPDCVGVAIGCLSDPNFPAPTLSV